MRSGTYIETIVTVNLLNIHGVSPLNERVLSR
jgi:hypothetical protein